MKNKLTLTISLFVAILALNFAASAQVKRPFHEGSVWAIGFIKMKPGMETAYLNYVAGDWKRQQEALKKDGQIMSYMVVTTSSHGTNDWNIMLMTEYKDLSTYEKSLEKTDMLMQTVIGNDEKQMQGYRDRLQIREVLQDRLGRQIILEPKR